MMTTSIPTSTTYVEPLERAQTNVTVLTVGIDESARAAIQAALEERIAGASTVNEATAETALARIESNPVDCVISSGDLSDSTGLELLADVREDHGSLPFVLVPAEGSESLAAAAVNAGVDGYFPNGEGSEADFAELAERVAAVVDDERTRESLVETTRLLLRLTEYTNDTLWMFTGDWEETAIVNSAYEDVWDRSIEDLLEDPSDFLEDIVPADQEEVLAAMETLSSGEVVDIEYRIETDDDTRWLSVHAEPVFDSAGIIEYVAGFTRDVSGLKERELSMQRLNEASNELLGAREKQQVADTVVDVAESVIGCPLAVVRHADTQQSQLVPVAATQTALDIKGSADISDVKSVPSEHWMYEAFRAGEMETTTDPASLAELASGPGRIGSLVAVPLGDHGVLGVGTRSGQELDDYQLQLLSILGQTATAALDRVQRDNELEAHRKQLEQSNENLQQFAYVASHDLQEPLRMVSSYVDLLESEYGDELDGEAREYMDFAVDGAERMKDMIDALLQYARVQTQAKEFEETDPNRVLDETLDALQLRIEETDATVSADPMPTVRTDPSQLGQLFQNLLKNAFTYASESGVSPQIEVSATTADGQVTFTVADNGPGIDESARAEIFDIFKRSGTQASEGTGIGLAVCRRIVRRHDGEIWLDSADDGATFKFTMPAATPEVMADD